MLFDSVWALGEWVENDSVLRAWERAAKGAGMELKSQPNIRKTVTSLSQKSLVLFSYRSGVPYSTLTAIKDTKCRLLVYTPSGEPHLSTHEAVKLCSEGVLAFFLGRQDLPDSLRDRLDHLYAGRKMFMQIDPQVANRQKPPSAFVASPYAQAIEAGFMAAATDALEGCGVRVKNPRRYHYRGNLGQKVDGLIAESDFMVANLRLSEEGFNPNVWSEIGYAHALKKPIIPFCFAGDAKPVPSDLEGIDYIKYYDPMDLAMKLYWGLEWMGYPPL